MSAEQIAGLVLLVAFIGFVFFLARNSRKNEKREPGTATPPPPAHTAEEDSVPQEKPAGKAKRRS